jgi:hypothetical protein
LSTARMVLSAASVSATQVAGLLRMEIM